MKCLVCLMLIVLIHASIAQAEAPYNVAWSRQIGTTTLDHNSGVAVDVAGNAYISGYTFGSIGGPNAGQGDAFVTKYDATGNLLWSRQIGTTEGDGSNGVAVDAGGNAYISGGTSGSLGGPNVGGPDAFLTKYDVAGNLLWSRQIGTTADDESRGVAVDASGNAYISGYTYGSIGGANAGFYDAFLTKFSATGNLLWSRQIGTAEDDESRGVAVDAAGNAYISGYTRGSLGGPNPNPGTADAFLTKYSSAGNFLWSRQIGTTDHEDSFDVAVDAAGNAYITGLTGGDLGGPNAGGFGDAFLTKYDAAGNHLWSRQIGTTDQDYSLAMAVDAAGNAYISGQTSGSLGGPSAGGEDPFLTKYDGAGNLLWSRQIGTTEYDVSLGLAVGAAGNPYISGITYGSLGGPNAGSEDVFLVKYAVPEPSTFILAIVALGLCHTRRSGATTI